MAPEDVELAKLKLLGVIAISVLFGFTLGACVTSDGIWAVPKGKERCD